MLLGEFNHSIDEKGRLIIPAKLRDDLGESFVICNGLEGCLFVYSQDEWNQFVAELNTLPRMNKDARIFKRYFLEVLLRAVLTSRGGFLYLHHFEKLHIWRRTLSWWEFRTAWRSGIKHFGKSAVWSVKKIWMRLQNVWRRSVSEFDSGQRVNGGFYGI